MADNVKSKLAPFAADYPVRRLFSVIADAWTPIVIHVLADGTKRFGELQRLIPDISRKMLTQTLRKLEASGFVHREVFPVVPPHTEYSLTEKGLRLHEPLAGLCDWAKTNTEILPEAKGR